MSAFSTAKDALKMLDNVLTGIEVIQGLTQLGGEQATAALAAIAGIIGHIEDGLAGTVTPEQALAGIKTMRDLIAADEAAADAKLHTKFDTTDKGPG